MIFLATISIIRIISLVSLVWKALNIAQQLGYS